MVLVLPSRPLAVCPPPPSNHYNDNLPFNTIRDGWAEERKEVAVNVYVAHTFSNTPWEMRVTIVYKKKKKEHKVHARAETGGSTNRHSTNFEKNALKYFGCSISNVK